MFVTITSDSPYIVPQEARTEGPGGSQEQHIDLTPRVTISGDGLVRQ